MATLSKRSVACFLAALLASTFAFEHIPAFGEGDLSVRAAVMDEPWPLNAASVPQQSGALFKALSTSAPPTSYFGTGVTHPRQPVNIGGDPSSLPPIGTNKWYNQLTLPAAGTDPIFPLPYAVAYLNGSSTLSAPKAQRFVGVGISHAFASRRTFGPDASANPVKFYINPLEIAMAFGANEIAASGGVSAQLTRWSELAATFSIAKKGTTKAAEASSRISFPISRGAAFFTAQYSNLTPVIRSGLAITSFTAAKSINGFAKWYISYNDGSNWLVYAAPKTSSGTALKLTKANQTDLTSSQGAWTGVIQVAKMPANWKAGDSIEALFDKSVGVWITGATVGSESKAGTYSFTWGTEGPRASSVAPLVYGLLHHSASLSSPSKPASPTVRLDSRTSGPLTLYQSTKWVFDEAANTTLAGRYSILPTNPTFDSQVAPTANDLKVLKKFATSEISVDFIQEANLTSYYFSGKKLAKQALLCLTASEIIKDANLTKACVAKTEQAILTFVQGKQAAPKLVYDKTWKGIISRAFLDTGDEFADFGNSVYNDHHFHDSYFVHAAAVMIKLDPSFKSKVAPWITSLIRDVSNPNTADKYFPFFRNFDWYAGHSWATGLQSALDGKNQESSSEDANFIYALKSWAEVIGDSNLLALANMQLAILRRAINTYYLLRNGNNAHPSNFIRNRVAGILFENKCDYTTFFSDAKEAIHMIQNIPILPITPFIRDLDFVQQQWTDSGSKSEPASNEISAIATTKSSGYRTLLYDQYAVLQPRQVLDGIIANTSLPVDDGSSVTWNIAFAISQLGRLSSQETPA